MRAKMEAESQSKRSRASMKALASLQQEQAALDIAEETAAVDIENARRAIEDGNARVAAAGRQLARLQVQVDLGARK